MKGRKIKLSSGDRFGFLVVGSKAISLIYGKEDHKQGAYNCKCICGINIIVSTVNLINGNTKSCGCKRGYYRKLSINKNFQKREIKLNDRFGILTIKEDKKTKSLHVIYKCLCDCGKIKNVRAYNLIAGNIKSCGCITKNI